MAFIKLLVILVSTIFCVKNVFSQIESTAVLLECAKGSSNDDIRRKSPPYHSIDNCIRKIRITINITNIGKTPPEEIFAFVNHIKDPDNMATMYLLNPVVVRLRQEQVLQAYPFHYLSAVNAKASEIVVNYENRKNFTGCDDTSMINPTCGLKHEKGRAVPFSEGFCCDCPPKPVHEKQPRGGQDCSLDVGRDPLDAEKQKYKASAHCLHFSDVWYSISALSKPFILHETFLQVFIEKYFKNSSSAWFALTHDEEFALGPQNTYQYDDNKTIVISYLTDGPSDEAITLPLDRRLLTPLPMPNVELADVSTPVKNGATDYLLLPKEVIDPEGDVCDTAGVSYKAFAFQPDRCKVPKNTCLKNQPLDFWEEDNEKRASGVKGDYLLENFGIPYKDPIIVDPETREHWLALEYHDQHTTVLFVEINADEITIMTVGKHAQISKITSSTVSKTIYILVSVLNADLMPSEFTVQAVNCAYGVPDSNKESVTIPPQLTEDVIIVTKSGSTFLDEEFGCTVQVTSESYGVVAKREVVIHPRSRCVCDLQCECACMSNVLECELMSEKDYHAAGFRGSLPVLTAEPPEQSWFVEHPLLAFFITIVVMLEIGLAKALIGLLGCHKIGDFGMEKIFYRRGEIKSYVQPRLKNLDPVYDDEGYPIHPYTGERVKVVADIMDVAYNTLFLFIFPCLMCRKCFEKAFKLKKNVTKKAPRSYPGYTDIYTDEEREVSEEISYKKKMEPFEATSSKGKKGQKNKHSDKQEIHGKNSAIRGEKAKAAGSAIDANKKQEGSNQRGREGSEVAETSFIPVDLRSKEQKQWQKGKQRVGEILSRKKKHPTVPPKE